MGLSAGRYGGGGYARLRRAQRREAGVWAAIGGCADVRASRARGAMRAGDMRACGAREGTAEREGARAYYGIGIANVKECSITQGSICSMFPRDINRVAP